MKNMINIYDNSCYYSNICGDREARRWYRAETCWNCDRPEKKSVSKSIRAALHGFSCRRAGKKATFLKGIAYGEYYQY